jgi:hypothetical protein
MGEHDRLGMSMLTARQPWQQRRDGETLWEWNRRTNHTCWRCGHYEPDLDVLDAHEEEHR